jgi:hypothetical protein
VALRFLEPVIAVTVLEGDVFLGLVLPISAGLAFGLLRVLFG